jgi:hypothetical protein
MDTLPLWVNTLRFMPISPAKPGVMPIRFVRPRNGSAHYLREVMCNESDGDRKHIEEEDSPRRRAEALK